jgi:valyl-tRNA synthetase
LWPEIKEINKESEELGKLLVDLTSAVRKEKSEKGLSLKKEIKELVIDCDDSSKEKINKFTKDLKEVNGIKEIKFGKTKEGIEIKENIKIKIEFL